MDKETPCLYPHKEPKRLVSPEGVGEDKDGRSDWIGGVTGLVTTALELAFHDIFIAEPKLGNAIGKRHRDRWLKWQRSRLDALRWIFTPNTRFCEFCHWLDLNPEMLRDRVQQQLEAEQKAKP